MKKNWMTLLALLIIVSLFVFFSTRISVRSGKEAWIEAPYPKVCETFTDLRNWKKWFSDLKHSDTSSWKHSASTTTEGSFLRSGEDQYTILRCTPVSITVKMQRKSQIRYFQITAQPDTVPTRTRVEWISYTSPVGWLRDQMGIGGSRARLKSLRDYLEDPAQYYGFSISLERVVDTLVLTKEAIVKRTLLTDSLSAIYGQLIRYAANRGMPELPESPRMATFYETQGDSIRVAVGIPLTRRIPVAGNMRLLEMPATGKMLVGQYEGSYQGLGALYRAMQQFTVDKKLRIIGAIYEKYLTAPHSAADSLHMKIELHFPVV